MDQCFIAETKVNPHNVINTTAAGKQQEEALKRTAGLKCQCLSVRHR